MNEWMKLCSLEQVGNIFCLNLQISRYIIKYALKIDLGWSEMHLKMRHIFGIRDTIWSKNLKKHQPCNSSLTHSVDEFILNGILLLLRCTVHAWGSAHRLLAHMSSSPSTSSGWLHASLHVIGRLWGIAELDGPQAEGAAPHWLPVEQDREGELALWAESVADLVSAILVVCYVRFVDGSIWTADLSPQCSISSLY